MKTTITTILLFLFCICSNAQSWIWSEGANVGSGVLGISVDGNGNVFSVGYFESPTITFGSITLTNPTPNVHLFIVKHDANGAVLWAKSAVSNDTSIAYAVTTDKSGNVYM